MASMFREARVGAERGGFRGARGRPAPRAAGVISRFLIFVDRGGNGRWREAAAAGVGVATGACGAS